MSGFSWTAEQADAIGRTGHTLLEANAGAGKTTTVVGKILWHLGLPAGVDQRGAAIPACPAEHRIRLDQLAAITFTEKAAYDLARKLRDEVRRHAPDLLWDIDRAAIGTIHSFCGELLREHALRFGVDPGFRVLDEREARLELSALAREVILEAAERDAPAARCLLERFDLDPAGEFGGGLVQYLTAMARDLRWHRERYAGWTAAHGLDWKRLNRLAGGADDRDEATAAICDALVALGRTLVDRWTGFLRAENLRDFDALILDCRDALLAPSAVAALAAIRSRCRLLLIDEFQDTDAAQRDVAFLIAGLAGPAEAGPGPQLFLVGDPKQSIYGFRGADITVWNEVSDRLGPPLRLSRNYRSVPEVIRYVNRAAGAVLAEAAEAARQDRIGGEPPCAVEWVPLEEGRPATAAAGLEWLAIGAPRADERRDAEAELIATRIRDLVVDRERGDPEGAEVVDPDSGERREARYRDVAILFRASTGVERYAAALARWGVPYYLAGNLGLARQLELEDLLNLFRLVANPLDDLAAFTWLRSPFVGLRDEVLARIRLEAPHRPLLRAARAWLEGDTWYAAPEHPDIVALERAALSRGLELIEDLAALRSRAPLDQLALLALERSGYPLHLQLLDQPLPRLANLQRFVRVLEGYRGHTVGSFLELWDEWRNEDVGLPQAPLHSRHDDVVTLSTVHAAKGLEWPIVFLADLGELRDGQTNTLWSDRTLGPLLAPKQAERGPRARRLCARRQAEERAEEARVFYVAATRARDRLVLAGPASPRKGRAEWAWRGVGGDVRVTSAITGVIPLPPAPEPTLAWLDGITARGAPPPLVPPLPAPGLRYTRSATELMARARGRADHRLRYVHGVLPVWRFAPGGGAADAAGPRLRADLKGTIVHGVLERIRDEEEVAELLDAVVGSVDADDLSEELGRDGALREAIEAEIRRVVASPEWRWYVEGPHWRELAFVELRCPRRWRVGAMDLYRPGQPGVIVDFKTQEITAGQAAAEARKYRLQAATYRAVLRGVAGAEAATRFHFTVPGVVAAAD